MRSGVALVGGDNVLREHVADFRKGVEERGRGLLACAAAVASRLSSGVCECARTLFRQGLRRGAEVVADNGAGGVAVREGTGPMATGE